MQRYIIDTIEQAEELSEWLNEIPEKHESFGTIIRIPLLNEEFVLKDKALEYFTKEEQNKLVERLVEKNKKEILPENNEGYTLEVYSKQAKFCEKSPYENDLIFGKDKTEQVVAVEVKNDNVHLFLNNGEIKEIPHTYWFMGPRSGASSTKLEGNLHYKYITKYDNFDDFKEARNVLYKYKADFYTIFDEQESAMVYNGITQFKGLRVDDVSVLSFDIEANGLIDNETNEPIVGNKAEVYMISNTFRKDGKITKKVFSEDEYESQEALITAWCKFIQEMNPTIIVGHNIFGYDLPYLSFVYKKETGGDDLILGRDFSEIEYNKRPSEFRKDGSQSYKYYNAKVFGRHLIDTMFLAIKYDFGRKYPSYGLKAIIEFEGLIKKDRQFYDATKISENWKNLEERKKIKKYGEDDSDDSLALYDLMIPQYFYYAQSIPKSLQKINNSATGSQINSFLVRSYLQVGHSLPKASEAEKYKGAISLGNAGVWEHVNKVDVASLYPSIMITEEVYDREKDPKANFLNMVKYFTAERLNNKRLGNETGDRYYKDLDQAQKIVINSAYGMLGAPGLLFNSPKKAAFVTKTGRDILQVGIKWACGNEAKEIPEFKKDGTPKLKKSGEPKTKWFVDNNVIGGKGFKIVNVDTDSFSYTTGKKLEDTDFAEHINEVNNLYKAGIVWEDDGRYKTVLVVKAKNYALKSYDKKKAVKIKGSALKATMKELSLCDFIVEIMDALLNKKKDQIFSIYNCYAQEIVAPELDITRWSSKKTVTKSVLNPERTNEERVLKAIEGRNFKEGDKFRTYFSKDENMPVKLEEDYSGDHDQIKLLEKIYKTLEVFETVIDIDCFPNYKLKKNQKHLGLK